MQRKNLLVLGAGFGGLRVAMLTARELKRLDLLDKYQVTLVDRNNCHLYTPLLYKLAASPENHTTCTYETTELVTGMPVNFVQDEIVALDLPNGTVHLKNGGDMRGEFIVVAVGSETNYFGIPGLRENALQLKTEESAAHIRVALSNAFKKGGTVNIIAGGAGANGIELAAEMKLWADMAHKKDPNLHATVSIVEAMPGILTGLDGRVIARAGARLRKLGIAVKTGAKITSVAPGEIAIDGGEKIPFDAFVWTGGTKAHDMLTTLPLGKDSHGKPLAQNDMECVPATSHLKPYPMVYVLGDSVCFVNPKTKRPVPAVARAAILQADVVTHNIIEEIQKMEWPMQRPKLREFVPSEYPYVIPIGERWAVAKFGPFVFSGWLGWVFDKLIEINYLISIMQLRKAFKAWRNMR